MQAKLEDLQDVLATFDVTIVFPSDPARQTPRIPAYVLEPVLLSKYYHDTNCTKPPCAVLLDFGNGWCNSTVLSISDRLCLISFCGGSSP